MEIDEIDGNDGHLYRLKKIDEVQKILTAQRDKRNELSTKYNRGVNIIGAIELAKTWVGLLSTFLDAPAVICIEAVSIVIGLLRVVRNQATKKQSLKTENMKRLRWQQFPLITLSVVSFPQYYQMAPFHTKNIQLFQRRLKVSQERKKILEKNLG